MNFCQFRARRGIFWQIYLSQYILTFKTSSGSLCTFGYAWFAVTTLFAYNTSLLCSIKDTYIVYILITWVIKKLHDWTFHSNFLRKASENIVNIKLTKHHYSLYKCKSQIRNTILYWLIYFQSNSLSSKLLTCCHGDDYNAKILRYC